MILPGLRRPVGTIWCAGRNYAEHAKELGNGIPSSPMIFLKPASSLMVDGGILRLPSDSKRVDHELELGGQRQRREVAHGRESRPPL